MCVKIVFFDDSIFDDKHHSRKESDEDNEDDATINIQKYRGTRIIHTYEIDRQTDRQKTPI